MEPIAIIGASCRFPGADGVDAFWKLLREGGNAITEIPPDRWDRDALFDSKQTARGKMTTRWGGFLNHIDQFDHAFFGISKREAATLDPQQRLLLETAWDALEDAGQPVDELAETATGVFVGIGPGDYGRIALRDLSLIDPHTNTGNFLSIAANRISFTFDFRGPSVAIDTACSSSLIAAHLACKSLSDHECDLALAGGVNAILSPELTIGLSKAGAMAPDGLCKAFDARANGYVRSEGAGLVVLKRLEDAMSDSDQIYAVILGSAINQSGRTNGLTAPSRRAQEAVLRAACCQAGVSPGRVQYVEAHGSGTVIGDLIETEALGAVYGPGRDTGNFCRIGSVKTNIGHLETAAGIAGLLKVALSIKHREVPASLHFKVPNPYIPFDDYHLRVQTELDKWPNTDGPALAAVSSFGFGGTNAHMVVGEPPAVSTVKRGDASTDDEPGFILPVSARSQEAIESFAHSYRRFLTNPEKPFVGSLSDLCYTASVRRSHHDYRMCFVFGSRDELINQLDAFANGELAPGVTTGRKHPTHRPPPCPEATDLQSNRDLPGALPPLQRHGLPERTTLESVGALYTLGSNISWDKFFPNGGQRVKLPAYPWQRTRCWLRAD